MRIDALAPRACTALAGFEQSGFVPPPGTTSPPLRLDADPDVDFANVDARRLDRARTFLAGASTRAFASTESPISSTAAPPQDYPFSLRGSGALIEAYPTTHADRCVNRSTAAWANNESALELCDLVGLKEQPIRLMPVMTEPARAGSVVISSQGTPEDLFDLT